MDKTFQKLLQTDIDLSSLGVERRTDNEPYFCTPKGASVFGWTGVDGIHFCFVRGFGGMVFAVSPANTFPNYVHPLAKNFADFLRLLHLVLPYLLVSMILSTPSYSLEKIGASMMITARASATKTRTMFRLVESQPST